MKKKIIIVTIFLFFFSDVKSIAASQELIIKKRAELYEEQLFNYLYNIVDKEFLAKNTLSNFTSKKSNTLTFVESIGMYLYAIQDEKYNKYVIWALERMYSLSSDARLNELILWNLAAQYEKKENFPLATELYAIFKKLFPGSRFYWTARYKEIFCSYKYCQYEYHDITHIEKTMKLCEEYIVDVMTIQTDFLIDVFYIFQDLSLRVLKKNLNIIGFYSQKYTYSFQETTFLSSLQRLEAIAAYIDYLESYCDENIKTKKNQIYRIILQETKKSIEDFFAFYQIEKLPSGENFISEYEAIMEKIKQKKKCLTRDIVEVEKKILFHIAAYYEL